MLRGPLAGQTPQQDPVTSTAESRPTRTPEHGDELDSLSERIEVKAEGLENPNSREVEGEATSQQASTGKGHVHDISALAASPPSMSSHKSDPQKATLATDTTSGSIMEGQDSKWRQRLRNPWACSLSTLAATLLGFAALFLMGQSFLTRQLDVKGCEMSYMRPGFMRYNDFDTEHTRFATKYSLYLYREGGIDDEFTVHQYACHGRR